MNVDTGDYYKSVKAALAAGEKEADLIEIQATQEQVELLSQKIKTANRAMAIPKSRRPKRR